MYHQCHLKKSLQRRFSPKQTFRKSNFNTKHCIDKEKTRIQLPSKSALYRYYISDPGSLPNAVPSCVTVLTTRGNDQITALLLIWSFILFLRIFVSKSTE